MIGFNTNEIPTELRADVEAPAGYADGAEGALPWDDEAAVTVDPNSPAALGFRTAWLDGAPESGNARLCATRFADGGVTVSVHGAGLGVNFVGLHLSVAAAAALRAFLNGEGA